MDRESAPMLLNEVTTVRAAEANRAREIMQPGRRLPCAFLAFLPLLFVSHEVVAQFHGLDVPADSFLWWSLSEGISPSELKRQHNDRALSLARYDLAVEAGLQPQLTPQQRRDLKFYVNSQVDPALIPMWLAFDEFSRGRISRRGVPGEAVPNELKSYGLSPSGIAVIMEGARACALAHEELMADLGAKQKEAQLLIRPRLLAERADSSQPQRPIMDAVRERDYDFVAAAVGKPVREIRELVDALASWGRLGGGSDMIARCLPALRHELSERDWNSFRLYLRDTIAAPLGEFLKFDEVPIE